MLVLSRKKGESIMIGDHVEVKVIAVDGDQVKLGIVAPKSVKVHRSEVFESIQQQNKEALEVAPDFVKNLKLKK
ncbi:carbon storage regulator [Lysinibacillus sp. 2017]|uniref:carbon storage regulator CsrA n=1 Tax=unclassified Lysinibacillus TaxID=2636778 RepID=UPI000D5277A0|nr:MULTISPECIES: carbon storage regulator CsrA [unclassified Lysinibacillus]AWE06387.1 carbon storage regulator [Lysinibacillus sp. 2017]TGN33393.1 carbon storage regulator [Lysinibacillus sp. S2017]